MVQLNSPELEHLASLLKKYDLQSTVAQLAGLLTVPSLQANTIRIEILVHLAVVHCRGRRKPSLMQIGRWLNRQFDKTHITVLEEPVEDVFVTNVETPHGNRRIFEGIWNSNDYYVQTVIDVLIGSTTPQECQNLLVPAFALLKLSDFVAERVGLERWHVEPSTPRSNIRLAPATRGAERARAVTFNYSELDKLNINRNELMPFILRDKDQQALRNEIIGHTSLEKRPLIDMGNGKLVLVLPHAVSPAIRRFVLSEIVRMGYLASFSNALAAYQTNQVEMEGLRELKKGSESLTPPAHDGPTPALGSFQLKYDINKYLHVVLLHDRLDHVHTQGLASFAEYSEEMRTGLEKYLSKVANHCKSLSDFSEGMTLLVVCGLGRGFNISFDNWPNQWRLSSICISNLLMLANESERPVAHYLKFIKQKESIKSEGLLFSSTADDYNLYCYWCQRNYQLVPRNVSLGTESMLSIASDFTLPARKTVRYLTDRHVTQTTDGIHVPVMRINSHSYFGSQRNRPIYGSLLHAYSGRLAGVVETPRGPSWFVVTSGASNKRDNDLLYRIWDGFIDLYDKLVPEVESYCADASTGAIQVRLDLSDVLMDVLIPQESLETQSDIIFSEPEVEIIPRQLTAIVKFPQHFFQYFMQPENIGEKLVLRSIAEGLFGLYKRTDKNLEEGILDALVDKIITDPDIRILHGFLTYEPIEHLQAKQNQEPIFMAQEDFVFSKLKLSNGYKSDAGDDKIKSKANCNKFLHQIVDKLWKQLRKQLQRLDRTSVVREMLWVDEAIIRDRDHWRHTARALQALSAPTDDIQTIAQKRELDRTVAGQSSRVILEMAICECPETGGTRLSRWELDEILAKTALLLEVAADSEAVNNDLVEPDVEIHPNGEYTLSRDFQKTVIEPFLTAYSREEFETAAAEYSKLYRNKPPEEQMKVDEAFSVEFIRSFQAEFGLTLEQVREGIIKLMELAVEYDSIIVETTLGNIKTRLASIRGFSPDITDAFVRTFGIFHRPAWDTPPEGFVKKDLYPWRFSRRLSVIVRPLLIFGKQDRDKVFFGVGMLQQGLIYLLDSAEKGRFPQGFFTSTEMKRYIGEANNKRGHAFARSVAAGLQNGGWRARTEVQMTELGAPATLGDIDILAWKPNGEILVVECKRLRLARTVAEIAEICRRFRGEAKDELYKHIQRINWIKENPEKLRPVTEYEPDPERIDDRLVTNTHVPMTYLKSLPISTDKIGPL